MDTLATIGFRANTDDLTKADTKLKNLATTGDKTEKSITKSSDGMSKGFMSARTATTALTTAVGALGAIIAANRLTQYADEWRSYNNVLKQVAKSEEEFNKIQKQVFDVAKATNSNLKSTAELYGELRRSVESLGVSSDRVLGVVGTINNLFLAGGKSAEEAAGAIRQLSQGLAAGALRGDEFNSVAEGAPRIMDALALKLKMTRGELREFAATGGITSKIMVDALEEYSQQAQRMADITERTWSQTSEVVSSNVAKWAGSSKAVMAATASLGTVLVAMSENIDHLFVGIGAGAAILASSMVPSMIAYVSSLSAAATATGVLTVATKFLLGPFGLVLAAISAATIAFRLSKKASDDDAKSKGKLADELDKLKSAYSSMNEEQNKALRNKYAQTYMQAQQAGMAIDQQRIDVSKKLADAEKKAAESNQRNGDSRNKATNQWAKVAASLKLELAALNVDAKENEKTIGALTKVFEQGLPTLESYSEVVDNTKTSFKGWPEDIKAVSDEMQKLIDRLDPLGAAQRQYAADYDALLGLMADTGDYEEVIRLMGLLDDEFAEFTKKEDEVQKIIDKTQSLGSSWTQTGSIIVDAFGNMSDAIDDYSSKMEKITDLEKVWIGVRDNAKSSTAQKMQAEQALADLTTESQKTQIGLLSKTAGAASSLFKEQSKERKALHAMEKGFAAIEIAMSLQKGLAAAASGAAKMFEQSGWGGFAGVAAMGVVLGGMGLAVSGGGGGSYTKPESGTGTVLGDSEASSSSVSNSMSEYKDIAYDQLSELEKISNGLTGLSDGIAKLATSLISSTSFGGGGAELKSSNFLDSKLGGVLRKLDPVARIMDAIGLGDIADKIFGSFSSKKQKLIDSGLKFDSQSMANIMSDGFEGYYYNVIETTKKKFWGLSKKTSTDTQFSGVESAILDQISSIFNYLGQTVSSSVDSLGIDTAKTIESFKVSLGSISFEDMTGEEIQKKLEQVIGQKGDLLAAYVLPQITEYQQIGEGALETLLRVSKEQAVFNDAIDKMGKSLGDVSAIMRVDVAQSIITMMGGLEEFTSATNEYFEQFFSESEQFDYLAKSLTESMSGLGETLPSTRDGFRAIVDALDLTSEADQQVFASLMRLVPGLDEYYDAIEKQTGAVSSVADLTNARTNLEIRLADALGNSSEALDMRRKLEIESTDESLRGLLQQIYAAQDLASANQIAADAARELADKELEIANQRQDLELRLMDALGMETEALAVRRQLELASIDDTNKALLMQIFAAEDAAKAEIELNEARQNSAQSAIDAANALIDAASKMMDDANSRASSSMSLVERAANAEKEQYNTLHQTRLDALTNEHSVAMSAIDAESNAAKAAHDAQLESLNNQKSAAEDSVNAARQLSDLLKNNSIVGGMNYGTAQQALVKMLSGAKGGSLPTSDSVSAVIEGLSQGRTFGSSTEMSFEQAVNAARLKELGTYADAQLSVEEMVLASIDAQIESASAANEAHMMRLDDQKLLLKATYDEAVAANDEWLQMQIDGVDKILASAEMQLNALLGIDDRILTLSDAMSEFTTSVNNAMIAQQNYEQTNAQQQNVIAKQTELLEKMASELEEMKFAQNSIAKNTATSANVAERTEIDGQVVRISA